MKVPKTSISMMVILSVWALVASMAVPVGVQIVRADGGGIEPPGVPENKKLGGPAIVGTMTVMNGSQSFAGSCKGAPISGGATIPLNMAAVTAQTLEGFNLPTAGPAGCLSVVGGEDLIINTVTKFTRVNADTVIADVVLLYLLPKNVP